MVSLTSRILVAAWGYTFLAAVFHWSLFPGDDPNRCRAVIQTGRWVDPADKYGAREPFNQWQPDGCLIHQYSSEDIRQCMDGRNFVFTGDSTLRQVAWGLTQLLRNDSKSRSILGGHDAWTASNYGQNVTYIWNPFVRLSGSWDPWKVRPNEPTQVNTSLFTDYIRTFAGEQKKSLSLKDQQGPALIAFGGGAWFASGKDKKLRDMWFKRYTETLFNVSNVFGSEKGGERPKPKLYSASFSQADGIGNQAFVVPPSGPVVPGDNLYDPGDSNRTSKSNERNEILRMQHWIRETDDKFNFHEAWALPATVEDQDKTFVEPYGNRWHYTDHISMVRANILLNLRCNAKLDRVRKYPTHQNCCTDYGNKPLVQSILVGAGMVLLAVCLGFDTLSMASTRFTPPNDLLSMKSAGALVLPLLMAYYADRTQIMAKGQKIWELSSFVLLSIPLAITALLTVRKSPSESEESETISTSVEQAPFLSHSQIAEWKGWMQLVIVLFHYVDGFKSVPLTIFSSILISSYLFLVGYEHTSHLLATQDYSLMYITKVLFRQNLLPCLLCFFMETSYIHYYYVILLNFYFIAVWAIMALQHERLNRDFQFLSLKICVCAAFLACLVTFTPIIRVGLFILRIFSNVRWDADAVEDCISKDICIAFIGMLVAVTKNFVRNFPVYFRYIFAAIGLATLERFYTTWLSQDTLFSNYWHWHDVAAIGPILAYVALRNASSTLRNYHSTTMAWVGGCSLELYLLHFHLFMAADNQGVLLTGAYSGDGSLLGDRWRDFVILAPIVLWVSSCAAAGTNSVLEAIIPSSDRLDAREDAEKSHHPESNTHMDSSSDRSSEDTEMGPWVGLLNQPRDVRYAKLKHKVLAFCSTQSSRPVLVFLAFWFINLLTRVPRNAVIPDGHNGTEIHASQQI